MDRQSKIDKEIEREKNNTMNNKDIYILGIETSCDETSAAVVKNGRELLSNIINSQIDEHEKYRRSCSRNSIKNACRGNKRCGKKSIRRSKYNNE